MRLKVLRGLKTANIPFICPLMTFRNLPPLRQPMHQCHLFFALKAKGKTPSGQRERSGPKNKYQALISLGLMQSYLCNVIPKPGVLELQCCKTQPRTSGSSREGGLSSIRALWNGFTLIPSATTEFSFRKVKGRQKQLF